MISVTIPLRTVSEANRHEHWRARQKRAGVADALGIDDRDPRVTWRYAQEKAKGYAVRVEIRRAT